MLKTVCIAFSILCLLQTLSFSQKSCFNGPKFIDTAVSKYLTDTIGIRDSLYNWLANFGYSLAKSDCGKVKMSSNFDGDSTVNPLGVSFFAEDSCGNTTSCSATFSYQNSVDCCCLTYGEIPFAGFDFEIPPFPPPMGGIRYCGGAMGPWTITKNCVDIVDPLQANMAAGNPNGPSYYADLNNSNTSPGGPGTMTYPLTGLIPGGQYKLEFYYCKSQINSNIKATVKIENGAWLNQTWTATTVGYVVWLKASYNFKAQAASTTLEFSDAGSTSAWESGMEIDDIHIYGCTSADQDPPVINNPPKDYKVACDKDIPKVPNLNASDLCDVNPKVTFIETTIAIDPCTKTIIRDFVVEDDCGNTTTAQQLIDVVDQYPPQFIKLPENQTFNCDTDVIKVFNDWIIKNGNAIATDSCGTVSWKRNYTRLPKKYCDTINVEFIATDNCGNENIRIARFIVRDTSSPKFVIKPQNKHYNNISGIRDSLREWLSTNAYSKINTNCDTIFLSSNFDGDSSKNPLELTFFVKDKCGNIDSSRATFSYQGGGTCCCGVTNELTFPNLDFESPPAAPPGLWIDYFTGQNYAGWNINSGSISIHDPGHLNLGAGNPNGSTQHMDLHGSTQGSATYTLTGLTAGYRYTISFWYAIHSGGGSNVTATLQVNGGSLLNVSWSASNPGNVIWFQTMYDFIADGSVADMKFIGTGSVPCCGMLIDDIQIFECPGDNEMPVVNNPPEDFEVECEGDAPPPPSLIVSDNCDSNPKITLKEKKETLDPCTKKITRTWEIKDACGNVTMEDQIIDIIDRTKPVFTKVPENEFENCTEDVVKAFNTWIKKNGNAIAKDNCSAVSWRTNYDRLPKNHCDTILTEFFITDVCGNENTGYAFFVVLDSVAPEFIIEAQNKNFVCASNVRDSLREWLTNYGYSKNSPDCDTVFLSHNFNGDSTRSPIAVTFYARDYCGNVDSSMAVFSFRNASDTFRITNYSCSLSGNSIDTIPYSNNGCDSIVILEQIKINPDSIYLKMNTCDPLQKPFDTLRLVNVNGCDSLVFLEHILQPTPVTLMQFMDCNYSVYSKDTLQFTGQFCDSFLIREFIPLRKDSISLQQSTCDKSQEGITVLYLKNSLGCDSMVTVNTIYTGVQNTFLTSMECGLLKNYTDTIIKSNGNCDSLFITSHIGLPIDTVLIQSSSCDKTKVGSFSSLLKNQNGCDSLVIETISLNPSDSIFISKSTCIASQAGIRIESLKNSFGCDSIITTSTQFIPSDTSTITQTTCDLSKVRSDTLIKPGQPCDSIVLINTVFIPSDTITISKTSCDPLNVGTDTLIIKGPECDSIYIINTAFLKSDTVAISQISCNPLDAGFTTYNYKNSAGCDSLVHVQTNYVPLQLKYELDSISCSDLNDGKFTVLNSGDFSNAFELIVNNNKLGNQTQLNNLAPGNYEIFIQDKNGCVTDSIQFNLMNPSALIIDLGNDYLVNKGTLIQLNLQSNKTLTNIFWSPSTITTCSNCSQVQFTADQEGWIYAFAVDDRGCENRDSIYIRLKAETRIYAPTAISNNGDNINDNFYLIGDESVVIELLEIYDRWGELLFSTSNIAPNHPESGWNGTFKNEKMNPGVYVFYALIKFPDGTFNSLKGDFTLIR